MELFRPEVLEWFARTLGEPTPAQRLGWPVIASGGHTLILAPTGSGKTLAAFLWAIERLITRRAGEGPDAVEVLYVSPLKALNNDIERNLRAPLEGLPGARGIRVGVRTGDTPPARRRQMARRPPHILITTPESLYILLTSPERNRIFAGLKSVIVDEVHAVAGNKRGAHLSLSLERLVETAGEFQRIGLSATARPIEQMAGFLGGAGRAVEIVDAGSRRDLDVRILSPVEDYTALGERGIWPHIIPELLDQVRRHRTTLVFVQNRGQSERVAAWLNEAAGEPLAEAYHGSMARAARLDMEARLKAGGLRCLVATSALELGIDIGSIELVIQMQSPKSVTRALQRVGRAGHLVGATSKGRFFPTFRDDLAECAVIGSLLETGFLEPTRIPRNPADVLAQQIVACAALEAVDLDRLYAVVRRSYCYQDLPRPLFDRVVEMVAGRNVGDLRPAVSLDPVNRRLSGLSHSRRLAVLNAGAIPDRGLYPAYLAGKKTKLGELDEEFVHETRIGSAFVLGSSVYRLAEVTPHHVIVQPAAGAPLPQLPFWKGEGVGRGYQLSVELGRFRRELDLEDPDLLQKLEARCRLDRRSAWNLREYYCDQYRETGPLPSDRRVLIETFPDELGNWRLVIHSIFGERVNGLLEMLAVERVEASSGLRPESMHGDEGVILVFPAGERAPGNPLRSLDPVQAAAAIRAEVLRSAMFATRFRHCAERALLLPRPLPGRRAPLYLNRIRSANLLAQAARIPEFPLVAEAARECLEEALDYEGFLEVVSGLASGEIEMTELERSSPSPFAAAMQFGFLWAFMYDYDAPAAERAAQLAAVNRETLAGLLTPAELGRLVRPEAVEAVRQEQGYATPTRQARSPEDLLEILVRVGDRNAAELAAACRSPGLIEALVADGRALAIHIAGELRWITAEDAAHYAPGPDAFAIRRWVETRGPFLLAEAAARYGISPQQARGAIEEAGLEIAQIDDRLCARSSLRRIHRASLGMLRREIEPRSPDVYARFALAWQHLLERAPVLDVLEQLEGFPLPATEWRQILAPRVADPRQVEELLRSGDLVAAGIRPGWFTLFARGRGGLFLDPAPPALSRAAIRLLDFLASQGPAALADIRRQTDLPLAGVNTALAELFWAGRITCDSLSEIERLGRPTRAERQASALRPLLLDPLERPSRAESVARFRQAFRRLPGWQGRWSALRIRPLEPEIRHPELAAIALRRYGVLAREWHRHEDTSTTWSGLYPHLERGEWRGELRRGHFLEGLAGMQFALPEAVERLRSAPSSGYTLLHACDPANPYGPELAPQAGWRVSRRPGNQVLLKDGDCLLYSESSGARWWVAEQDQAAVEAYLERRSGDPISLQEVNGQPAANSAVARLLLSAGFQEAGGGLRQSWDRRP